MDRLNALIALLTLSVSCSLLMSCSIDADPRFEPGPATIRLTIPVEDRGAPDARLAFSIDAVPFPTDLTILNSDGTIATDFSGFVELRAEPGQIERIDGVQAGRVGPHVEVLNGQALGLTVHVARAFSDTNIWAEEIGFLPSEPLTAACNDGVDNDGDGFVDFPVDPGCAYANDGNETVGSHAVGVSDPIYFQNPSLADVQGRQTESPLDGRRVTVDQGTMIVTQITNDGFYLSEVDGMGGVVPWSHAFVFSFNTPPRLRACDQILQVSGSVVEFFGFTEVNFPSWQSEEWCPVDQVCTTRNGDEVTGAPCPIAEPLVVGSDSADPGVDITIGTAEMESAESALVRVVDAQFPSFLGPARPQGGGGGVWRFSANATNCDLNGDGDVTLSPGDEDDCNDACQGNPACSEWSQYTEFGQYSVRTAGAVINVVSTDTVPGIRPEENLDQMFPAITGTVRHFAPLGPERGYILQPRCEADFVMSGTPPPIGDTCVTPRTGGPDDPN